MTLQLSRASKSFGVDEIFENLNFEIKPNEKIAIIGRNGCGKTTLLKVLAEEIDLNKGEIFKPKELTVGYLAQASFKDESLIVEDYFLSLYQVIFSLEERIEAVAEELKHQSNEDKL